MREFWFRAATLAIFLTLCLGLGWLLDERLAATLVGLVCLLAFSLRDQLEIARLDRWLNSPADSAVPDGNGQWELLFAKLAQRERYHRRAREELAQRLERMREASRAMPDGTLILSRDDLIEWLNPMAEEHLGLDAKRDVGMPILNLVRPPEFAAYLNSRDYGDPLTMRSPRQPGRSLQLRVVPFGDEQKLLLSRDITQIEKLETMRRDFIANVSHEMKTPLTVVLGFLETLEDALPELSTEDALHYIAMARDQSVRMQRLVDDLLTLSSLETDTPSPEESVDVAALIEVVAAETRALSAGRHKVEVDLDGPAALLGCAKDLRSAFGNLASNAVRYTPQGGCVKLVWRVVDGHGEFAVEDDGIGISSEHIPRLTERFYRVDRGRSRETGGTGLGLAIVKHVLERHQAQLDVKSAPGQGSRFAVVFPARRTLAAAQAA